MCISSDIVIYAVICANRTGQQSVKVEMTSLSISDMALSAFRPKLNIAELVCGKICKRAPKK